jgi:amidohydrolase
MLIYLLFLAVMVMSLPVSAQEPGVDSLIAKEYPSLENLYKDLHSHPELSHQEIQTSKKVAEELRKVGFQVTENFGNYPDNSKKSYGIVALMKNGEGPTILVRTDLDALPVEEKTGLPYASKVKVKDEENAEVSVMHACGHDLHMAVFVGTARVLSSMKDRWHGTLIMIGQPSEEKTPSGAEALLRGGLYTKFSKPLYCIALHDDASLAVGKIGWTKQYALANVNSVDITVRGAGGHGAYPHMTKDPIVIAAEIVMALQTIVSREVPPGEPAVVTVGSIHGGTKHNIIPDEVKLQLTVRSYKKEIREQLLRSIERITKGIVASAGVPADRQPIIQVDEGTPAVYNNPELVDRLLPVFRKTFGEENVVERKPVMGGEDFSRYSLDDYSVPIFLFWLGAVDPKRIEESARTNQPLPSLHSSLFAPVPEPAMKTGIKAMTAAVIALMSPNQ